MSSAPYVRVALLLCVASAALAGRTPWFLLVVALTTAWVVRVQLSASPAVDPVALALVANAALLVAFPFARLPHDRVTSYVVVLSLLCVSAYPLIRTERQPVRGQVLLLALFGLLSLSSTLSPDAGAVKATATGAAAAAVTFLLAGRLDGSSRRHFSTAVVAMAVFQSALALAEPWLFPAHLWTSAQLDSNGSIVPLLNPILSVGERSQGTLGHPLLLGLLLLLGIAFLQRLYDDLSGVARLSLSLVLFGGLLMSGSRSELLCAVAVLMAGRRLTPARLTTAAGILLLALGGLITTGSLGSGPVTELLRSGSFLHRSSSFDSLGKLVYTQSWPNVFLGNGFLSTPRVFLTGRLQADGFQVVDNQFVLTLSQGGLLSLLALVALVLLGVVVAKPEVRPAVLCVALTLFVFDTLTSPAATALTFAVLGMAGRLPSRSWTGLQPFHDLLGPGQRQVASGPT